MKVSLLRPSLLYLIESELNLGCMVVELLDYRPQKSSEPALKNPDKTRVVLHPSPETLWADICSLNQRNGGRWTDMDALEIEAKLLVSLLPADYLPASHFIPARTISTFVPRSGSSSDTDCQQRSEGLNPKHAALS
jgi:transcription factor SPT20